MVKRGEILTELGRIERKFKIVWILDTCYAKSFWESSIKSINEESFPLFVDSMKDFYVSKEAISLMYKYMLNQTYNNINEKSLFVSEINFSISSLPSLVLDEVKTISGSVSQALSISFL